MKRGAVVLLVVAMAGVTASRVSATIPPPGWKPHPSTYWVGIAARSIDPKPDGSFAGQRVYLGGYGFGSGHVGVGPVGADVLQGRYATGLLKDAHPETGDPGIFARAMVVSADGSPKHAVVFGESAKQTVVNSKHLTFDLLVSLRGDVADAGRRAAGGRFLLRRLVPLPGHMVLSHPR